MLHCLDVLRVNGYILYKETSKKHPDVVERNILDQKEFLKRLVHSLRTRAATAVDDSSSDDDVTVLKVVNRKHDRSTKLTVQNHNLDHFFPNRLKCTDEGDNVVSQNKCKYCSYLNKRDRKNGKSRKEAHKIKKSKWWCRTCKVNLCKNTGCFQKFHGRKI